MEYKEFVEQRKRMCNSYKRCNSACGLYEFISDRIECQSLCLDVYTAEKLKKIVENWSREHPVKTRADLFRQQYKDRPWQKHVNTAQCERTKTCSMRIPCSYCEWWGEEVKEK